MVMNHHLSAAVSRALITILFSLFLIGVPLSAQPQPADPIIVMSWNVESGDSNPQTIKAQLGEYEGVDLWGLSEVLVTNAETFEQGAEIGEGVDFEHIVSSTGGAIRLLILYNADRFEKISHEELEDPLTDPNQRNPLVAHLRDKPTGIEFLFVVNHLARNNEAGRHAQAEFLNDWAANDAGGLPIIAVGDYNFDYDIVTEVRDEGFDLMTANGVFEWVRPPVLVTTQCSVVNVNQCQFNSVLDFVFVAGDAQNWDATSEIVVKPGDFPDDNTTSDHRPVRADIILPGDEVIITPTITPTEESAVVTKADILEKIAELEAELAELKALVEQLPD
jgi:endonuclease/exonuclease/phosphatase family metal-dependent hydrolase